MMRNCVCALVISTLLLLGLAPLGKAQSTSGLVAYYPFDGNANDLSGNGRNGIEYNGVAYVPGVKGQAANFNGINAYIKASSDGLPTGARTISLWFYARKIAMPRPVLLGYGGSDSTCGTSWFMMLDPAPSPPFYISGHCHSYDLWAPYYPTPIGAWYHLAVTTDPTGTKFFVNGQNVASNSLFVNNTIVLPGRDLTIGVDVWYQGLGPYTDINVGYFDGLIDELRIYKRALSQDDILQLYYEGAPRMAILPTAGGDTGTVTVTISGIPFVSGTSVRLVRAGQSDIVAQSVSASPDNLNIQATFDLTGRPRGVWDVIVSLPGGALATLPSSFTIEQGRAAQLWVDILGRNAIRAGVEEEFWVVYGNAGNIDAKDVVLSVTHPAPSQSLAADAKTSVAAPADSREPATTGRKDVWIEKKVPPEKVNAIALVIKLFDPLMCWLTTISPAILESHNLQQALMLRGYSPPVAEELASKFYDSYIAHRINEITPADLLAIIRPIVEHINETLGAGLDLALVLNDMAEVLDPPGAEASKCVQVGVALDPNEKVGLQGISAQRYISGAHPLTYAIYFENQPTATLPAQTVTITDTLNPSAVDLNTLILGPVSVVGKLVTPPSIPLALSQYSADIDLRPGTNLIVRTKASFDTTTNILKWTFTSIDPATGQPTTDPLAGFLPPGAEGSVSFAVAPKTPTTGTQITNKATIVFDVNPPIDTSVWLNTIDKSLPTSRVSALAPQQTATSFAVSWSGSDVGAGIRDYTVYVSDNGAPFNGWLTNTTATQAMYSGSAGHTYGFYSIARDLTNNIEAAKTAADATTRIVASDTTPPIIVPQITGTLGNNGWYRSNVTVTWNVSDPESGIVSSTGCAPNTLTADTAGITLTCSATNGAGLTRSVPVTIKIDKTPPAITGLPAAGCTLWPPDHKLIKVATVSTSDTLSGLATFGVTGTSNEPENGLDDGDTAPDIVITGAGLQPRVIQLRQERSGTGTGRIYTLTATSTDPAGNTTTASATCTAPLNQAR